MQSNDLIDFMNSATGQMSDEYNRIQKRALEDPGTAGDQGEENWATVFRNWLPPTFHVVTKGRILGHEGVASPQVDVIILQPEYPKHLLDKKLFLADGILAAFECKVTLKALHISDFIKNSALIKSQAGVRTGSPYREIQSPIIYGLLTHAHSWKGKESEPLNNITNAIIKADELYISHPRLMPDVICVADLSFWSSGKIVFISPRTLPDWSTMPLNYSEKEMAVSYYLESKMMFKEHALHFTPIGALITTLWNKISYEDPSLRKLAQYFLNVNMVGSEQGKMRIWEMSIYSNEIRNRIVSGELKQGEPWDEWNWSIP